MNQGWLRRSRPSFAKTLERDAIRKRARERDEHSFDSFPSSKPVFPGQPKWPHASTDKNRERLFDCVFESVSGCVHMLCGQIICVIRVAAAPHSSRAMLMWSVRCFCYYCEYTSIKIDRFLRQGLRTINHNIAFKVFNLFCMYFKRRVNAEV